MSRKSTIRHWRNLARGSRFWTVGSGQGHKKVTSKTPCFPEWVTRVMFFYKFSSRERSNNTHISTLRQEFSADAKNRDPRDPRP